MMHYRTRMARGERGVIPVIAEKPLPRFADVGSAVRRLRTQAGLKQYVLAEMTGLDQSSLSKIEGGVKRPRRTSLLAIAGALSLTSSTTGHLLAVAGYQQGGGL